MMITVSMLLLLVGQPPPADWDSLARRAAELMQQGKVPEAIELLEGVTRRAPGFDAAQYELATAHHYRAGQLALEGDTAPARRAHHLSEAARIFEAIVRRKGPYRPPALGRLLLVYDEDELDDPAALAVAARAYIGADSRSAVGHLALAAALRRTGQPAAAWATLDAACVAVWPDDASSLTRGILLHLTDALPHVLPGASTPAGPSPVALDVLARLLQYAEATLSRELASDPADRQAAVARATALMLRAQRLERDPGRRRTLEAEASALLLPGQRAGAGGAASQELAFVGEGQQRAAQPPSALADAQSRADALVARKEYDQAAAIYDGLIASQPQSMPPRYLRVAVLAQAGRSADVESGLLAARKALPATPEARLEAGAHLEELARKGTSLPPADRTRLFAEAVILFDEALAMRADLADAMAYKSIALRGQSRLESNAAEASRLMAEAERMTAAAQAARKP